MMLKAARKRHIFVCLKVLNNPVDDFSQAHRLIGQYAVNLIKKQQFFIILTNKLLHFISKQPCGREGTRQLEFEILQTNFLSFLDLK